MNRRLLLTPFLSFFFLCGALAQAPVAMIKASPVAGCAPLAVGFNDVSSGNPTSWSWNFGGAPPTVNPGTSTNPNAGVIYTVPGTYFVTLTVSNASGTNTSAPFKITVFPSPTADFDADKLTGCFPTTVHFTDKSSPGIGGATMVSWSWSYGDGNVDPNTQNPSHTYTQGGSFPVTLYVTNNYGCVGKANVKTGAIVLSTGVIPNYNTTLANSCQVPVDATFTNSTTGPGTVTYNWDFGDGGTSTQTSPIHPFSAAGNYNVKLTATSDQGCSDTVTTVVKIASSANVSSFTTAASVCINAPATFTNTSTPFPNSSSWNYGDGSPIDNVRDGLHTYNTAGPYTVTLNNDFSNCNGSVSQTIQVVGPPTAAFIGTSVAGCKPPLTASFTDQSTGATSWLWDFGDGSAKSTLQNPTHTYNAYGSYNVTLTASSAGGCSNSITKNAFVNIIKPIVSIPSLPAYGCAPYTFNPSISVTQAEGIASYHWDFGNGTTFDGATPPPQVYGTGSFPVTLTITTNGGCTASTSGTVKVGSIQPVSDFTASPLTACVNTPIQFTDKSTGGANQWFWDFGDGNSSTLQNPANSFQKPGTFIVKLTAYNDGCYQPTPKTVNITINNPLADFSYSFDCTNSNNFSFKDGSTGPLTWAWDFGDGGTSAAQNPTHSFTPGAPTTFNVSLTVTNGACQSSITKSVTANQVTAISVSANPICKNNTVLINTTHPNNIVSYLFDFGDGTTANSSSGATSHTYTIAKDYQVTVKTTDNTGCSATSAPYTMHITGPTAKFSTPVQQGCNNFSPTFTDLSSFTAGIPITTWAWDFGDGGVSNQQSPTHNYTTEGIFSVKLKVTDANGCTDSVVYPSYITFSAPKASFTTTGTDFGTCSNIKFTNTSQGLFNPVYTWDFKDGSTFIGKDPPLHNFPAVGQYPVTLSITDALGCSAAPFVMAVPINIDTPNASFTMSANYSSCPPLTDHFTFTGHYAQSYRWDLGNGVFSVLQNPSFTYPVPGDWDVSLIVTSPGGCLAKSASQHIHIDGPVGVFLYSPTSACDSLDVNFEVKTGNAVQFTWIFGDNSLPVTDTVPTITHHYNQPGQYIPVVTMEDASGCKVATTGNQTIFIDAIIGTSFTIDKPLICDNSDGKITFTDNSSLARGTVINNYFWDFGDGSTQSGMLPTVTHIFTGVQTYNVTLTITTVNGCGDSKTLPVQVVAAPQISIGGLTPQCEPATLTFTGVETISDPNGPLTWAWDFGNGQTSNVQNPPAVSYPKAGTYTVTLAATNTAGCTSTVPAPPQPLIIYPIPKVDAGPDMTVCLGGPDFQLNATGDPGNSYTWQTPANGTLSCYPCANPMANSPISTYFVVNGQSPFGCSANDTVKIKVNTPVTVTVSGADSVCLGQSTQLTASGADLYTWTPAAGLSNPSIPNPIATPGSTQIGITSYQVTGTDDIKCFSDTKTVQITTFNYPTLDLGPDVTIPVGTSYQINGTGSPDIVSLNWLPITNLSCPDCLTPLASPIKTVDYVLHAVNNGGCTASDSIRITVICDGSNFFIPNTFSPNGDGSNDRFVVRGRGLNVIPSITIFNRWGQVVFEKKNFAPNDEASGWDGTYNGKPAPSDVYIYTIQIFCDNATLIPYHGNVTLIR